MEKKKKRRFLIIWLLLLAATLAGVILIKPPESEESVKFMMYDAVMHEYGKISLFGLMEVNPAVVSAFTVTGIILLFAAIVRIFVIPHFKDVPGKFQLLLEAWVGFFDGLAKTNSPHRNKFLGAYIFTAGSYICLSTLFELFGLQVVNTEGISMAMPAPLADINGAICLGALSYLVILGGGIIANGGRGAAGVLKDFSLPISMSFRLFGALLSGLLVTELVYYYITISFVLPVIVGVLFTGIHSLVQTYVLCMLTSVFYGEATEVHEKKKKDEKAAA